MLDIEMTLSKEKICQVTGVVNAIEQSRKNEVRIKTGH